MSSIYNDCLKSKRQIEVTSFPKIKNISPRLIEFSMPTYIFSKAIIEKIHTGEVSAAIFPRSKQGVAGLRAYFFETGHLVELASSSRLRAVTPIVVTLKICLVNNQILSPDALQEIVQACGFDNYDGLVASIQSQFTLPFDGRIHSWHPPHINNPTVVNGAA